MNKVRVRFAPSPTGFMHIGNFRSALYDYLFAKKNNGDFILRIEDTDRKRFVEGALESLIKMLHWADLKYDEGVFLDVGRLKGEENLRRPTSKSSENYQGIIEVGEYGPYIQSEKLDVYKKYAEQLVADGHAYYCFCEPERLEKLRMEQVAEKKAPMYDQYCLRNVTPDEINKKLKENCSYTIRLKIPQGEIIEFTDMVRGNVKFKTDTVDDQVLLKSDGFPTYHLANIIDDHDMKITHVIRGEEWLSSVPKHLLIYRYLGWEAPEFAHLPLLLNPDRTKLSKRQGDVAVEDYMKYGYLKEAIINFVALLGWNPGEGSTQEIFTLEELVEKFDFAHVHKGGAVFDIKKLDWINAQWIKNLPIDELYDRSLEFWQQKEFYKSWSMKHGTWNDQEKEEFIKKVLTVERDRLTKLSEVGENNKFFFIDINYDKELLQWKDMTDEEIKISLQKCYDELEKFDDSDFGPIGPNSNPWLFEKVFIALAAERRGQLLWPLRVALTGEQKSPSPFEVAWVLGKDESLKRIKQALDKI